MTPRVLCIFIFKKKDLLSLFSEDVLVDHVRAGCIKSCTLVHLFCECEDCSMCGDLCAIKIVEQALEKKI